MKQISILCHCFLALLLCSGCNDAPSTEQATDSSEDNSVEPPPLKLNLTDARIDAIQNDKGEPIGQMKVGEPITVQGSFRIPGGSKAGPPPTTLILRDRNNLIHNSRGVRPELRGEDEYVYTFSVDAPSTPGEFTVEVSVLGQDIDQREMKVVR